MPRSHKPTHPTPLSPAEAAVPRNTGGKGWQAGGRFHWTSHFGSKRTNTGTREGGKGRGSLMGKPAAPVKPTLVPRWAHKYGEKNANDNH
jgi:hypothetical protein